MDILVLIALPYDTSVSLIDVGRTPRTVKVVERVEPVLDIRSRPHLFCGADDDPDITGIYSVKERLFLLIVFCLVDELDLLMRYTESNKLVPNV